MLLWLWCRPAATAPILIPSLRTCTCFGCSPKRQKTKDKIIIIIIILGMYAAFPGPSILGSELSAGAVRGPLSVMCRSSLPQTLGPKSAGGKCTCQVSQEQSSVDPTAPRTGPACLQPEVRAMPGCSNVFLFVSFFFFLSFCHFLGHSHSTWRFPG